jgi:hypothetical protein
MVLVVGPMRMTVVMMVMVMRVSRGLCQHFHARGRNACAKDARDAEFVRQPERGERVAEPIGRKTGVDEGGKQHVASRASRALDVHHTRH